MSSVDIGELERMLAEKVDENTITWIFQRIFLCYITFHIYELNLKTSKFLKDSVIEKLKEAKLKLNSLNLTKCYAEFLNSEFQDHSCLRFSYRQLPLS